MNKKIYSIILIFIIFLLPVKIFGYFATADEHINSMSFGAKNTNENIQDPSTPVNIIQNDNENLINSIQNTINIDNAVIGDSNNNILGLKPLSVDNISSRYYLLWSIIFIVVIIIIVTTIFYINRQNDKK